MREAVDIGLMSQGISQEAEAGQGGHLGLDGVRSEESTGPRF